MEKPRFDARQRRALQPAMLLPMAIAGLVLGLAYLMFVNQPGNPANAWYGGMALLVISGASAFATLTRLCCGT